LPLFQRRSHCTWKQFRIVVSGNNDADAHIRRHTSSILAGFRKESADDRRTPCIILVVISSLEHLAEVGRNLRLQVFDIRGCNDPAEFAHSSRYLLVNRTGCFHPQCLMRALLVVVLEPRPQGLPGFIQCLEVMTPDTLLFHSSDQSLNHPVLLRGVGTDGLLLQTVLVHRPSVMPRGKYQTVVTTQ